MIIIPHNEPIQIEIINILNLRHFFSFCIISSLNVIDGSVNSELIIVNNNNNNYSSIKFFNYYF